MKLSLYEEEWWPIWELDDPKKQSDYVVDVPQDLYARYEATRAAFKEVQKELQAVYEEQIRAPQRVEEQRRDAEEALRKLREDPSLPLTKPSQPQTFG